MLQQESHTASGNTQPCLSITRSASNISKEAGQKRHHPLPSAFDGHTLGPVFSSLLGTVVSSCVLPRSPAGYGRIYLSRLSDLGIITAVESWFDGRGLG